MSVNDGLSDEEWGAWGKPTESASLSKVDSPEGNTNLNNGFAGDSEVKFNAESSTSKFSNNYNNDKTGRFQEKKSGYNGNRETNNSRFGLKRDNNIENKFKSNNENYKSNGYANDRNKNKDYQSDFKSSDNKSRFDDQSSNKENGNYKNGNCRRDNSSDSYRNDRRNNSMERRTSRNGKRNDSPDRRNIRDDVRRDRLKRDDSRENRSNRRRDDSCENDRNSYRRNDKRDDSREKRKRKDDYDRDSSRENRSFRKKEDFDRDSSRDSRNRNYRKRDEFKRDDSREKSRNHKDGYKRDDSREKSRNYKDGYKRDDSREKSRNHKDGYKRDDSRENRKHYNKKDEFKRDESIENRNSSGRGRDSRNNGREENDRNRNSHRDHSSEDDFRGKKQQSQRDRDDKGYNKMVDEFQENAKLDDNEKFSSRTFVRGQKTIEKDNQVDDVAPIAKRATFIPDDDQEDYELHVNSGINFDNYEKIPVEVTGDESPLAINSFASLDLPDFLVANINQLKYSKLTPVQKYAIPIIHAKRDLMACAQTGSGKTAAFLIPIIQSLNEIHTETPASAVAFPKALIMAPTRELCRQIFTAARQLCRGSNVKCAYIYGGIEMNKSRRNIQASGCDILVATPGRLIHFLELVWISLRYLKFFVLDEADRMLESEGFYESVNKIYVDANCSGDDRNIQISMFSATFPNEIQSLARNLLKNYLFLAVGVVGSASSDVKQEIIQSDQREKVNTAIDYIKTIPDEKTLIFVESKRMADFFGIKLGFLGFKATTIHGDREQEQREVALNDFKSGRVNFMVATNVAARGLDIPKVDNVINIDMPGDIDTYVHRIGRTGRCGNVGRAISFFDDVKDIALAQPLANKLEEAGQECPDWLRTLCSGTGVRRSAYSRDTRKDVKTSKYIDNPTDDGFMKGTNIDYDDAKPSSEWLED